MQTVAQFFRDGGNLMFINLMVAVFALAVIGERIYMLGFRFRIPAKPFVESIEKQVTAGNFERAVKLCTTNSEKLLPRVIRAALANARLGGAAISSAVDEAMGEALPMVTKRAGILWGIANIATLIGLIGTIFGLIDSFAAQALASPEQKSILLTKGIAHAMNNTAFGLSIAVTSIVFHMVLSSLTKTLVEGLEYGATRIENILARRLMQTAQSATPTAQAE